MYFGNPDEKSGQPITYAKQDARKLAPSFSYKLAVITPTLNENGHPHLIYLITKLESHIRLLEIQTQSKQRLSIRNQVTNFYLLNYSFHCSKNKVFRKILHCV